MVGNKLLYCMLCHCPTSGMSKILFLILYQQFGDLWLPLRISRVLWSYRCSYARYPGKLPICGPGCSVPGSCHMSGGGGGWWVTCPPSQTQSWWVMTSKVCISGWPSAQHLRLASRWWVVPQQELQKDAVFRIPLSPLIWKCDQLTIFAMDVIVRSSILWICTVPSEIHKIISGKI